MALQGWSCPNSAGVSPRLLSAVIQLTLGFFTGIKLSNEPIKAAIAIAALKALSAACWEHGLAGDYRIQMDTDARFNRGVRVLGGVRVKKPDELLDVLAAGGSGYHFFGELAPRMVIERPA